MNPSAPTEDVEEVDVVTGGVGSDRPSWGSLRPDLVTFGAVALVLVAFVIPLRALFRYQGPPMEEGFMLVFPEQILNGQKPHEDFLHLYGPGSLWALALWYKVLGVSITAERIFGMLQLGGIVFGVMALVRPWGRRAMVASGLVGVLLTMTAIGLTALAWDGAVALLVASVWAALRGRRCLIDAAEVADAESEAKALRLFAAAGLLAGAALLFRPDVVIAVGASALVAFAGLAWRHRVRWLIGAFVGLLPYLYLFATVGMGTALEGMVVEPVVDLRGGRTLPRPPSWDQFDGALQKVASLREVDWPVPAFTSPQQAFIWFFLLPLVALFIVGVGWWRVRSEPGSWKARVVLTVGVLSVGLLPQAVQRPDSTHLAWVSCVPLAFLPAALTELLQHLPRPAIRRQAATVASVVTLAIPMLVLPHFTIRTYIDLGRQGVNDEVFGWPVQHEDRRFFLGSADIAAAVQEMIDEIAPQTAVGERIFVGTADLRKTPYSDAYLYHLFPDLVPATRYIEMDPGMANADGSGLADEVAASDWLFLSHIWDSWSEPNDSLLFGPDDANEVVRDRFCLVGEFTGPAGGEVPYFEVYRRCR